MVEVYAFVPGPTREAVNAGTGFDQPLPSMMSLMSTGDTLDQRTETV